MPSDFWSHLWNSGVPVVLLVIGIIVLWKTWRADVAQARIDRQEMVKSVDNMTESFNKLHDKIDSFFLSHFP